MLNTVLLRLNFVLWFDYGNVPARVNITISRCQHVYVLRVCRELCSVVLSYMRIVAFQPFEKMLNVPTFARPASSAYGQPETIQSDADSIPYGFGRFPLSLMGRQHYCRIVTVST